MRAVQDERFGYCRWSPAITEPLIWSWGCRCWC